MCWEKISDLDRDIYIVSYSHMELARCITKTNGIKKRKKNYNSQAYIFTYIDAARFFFFFLSFLFSFWQWKWQRQTLGEGKRKVIRLIGKLGTTMIETKLNAYCFGRSVGDVRLRIMQSCNFWFCFGVPLIMLTSSHDKVMQSMPLDAWSTFNLSSSIKMENQWICTNSPKVCFVSTRRMLVNSLKRS